MESQWEYYNESPDIKAVVKRYEDMKQAQMQYYFDVFEFERLIDFYLNEHDLLRASEVTRLAQQQHPSSTSLQLRQAQVIIETRPIKALNVLKKLEVLEPSNSEIFYQKGVAFLNLDNLKEALREFNQALIAEGDEKVDMLLDIGYILCKNNEYKHARRYLETAHEAAPTDEGVLYELAYCYEKLNELDKSRVFYERYLAEDAFSDTAWYNVGIVYNKLELYDKAIWAYEFAIAIDPKYSSAHYNLANVLTTKELYKESISAYRDFIELEPENASAYCYVAEAYEKLGNRASAIESYQKAIEIDPTYSDAYYGIGIVLFDDGEIESCKYNIQKAIELNDGIADYWYSMGNVYSFSEEFEKAEQAYRKSIELDAYDEMAWLNLSLAMYRTKRIDEAIDALIFAKKSLPASTEIDYRLSAYLIHKGDIKEALRHLENALMNDSSKVDEFLSYFPEEIQIEDIKVLINRYVNK